jgi:2-oxoglutarate dehydrogenase E1 component
MQFGSEFFRSNFTYIVEVYAKYKQNPSSVDESWKNFFENLSDDDKSLAEELNHASSKVVGKRNEFTSLTQDETNDILKKEKEAEKQKASALELAKKHGLTTNSSSSSIELELKELLQNYRSFGHLTSNLDPLEIMQKPFVPELQKDFTNEDLEKEVSLFGFKAKAKDQISFFKNIYTSNIGIECLHVKNTEERNWVYQEFETFNESAEFKNLEKYFLEVLIKSESFENALHIKFPGAKRFSAEGGEAVIASLEQMFLTSSNLGVNDVIIGMAHRGRLNVLTNILGKPFHALFSEFMGVSSIPKGVPGSGDVKYHLGLDTERTLNNGKVIKLSLTPNPSHLESVNPVVMGRVRAKQDRLSEENKSKVLPILIHGDAAMAGQGIVAECLAMANLKGYTVRGTIHIIINNQVGFTALQKDTKSGTYSSDVAKMIDAPIIHVNGNDVESVLKASIIASRYRQKFGKDVVLEIVCYRKYGHNEGDEPMFTQPFMYKKIKGMETPAKIYAKSLKSKGLIDDIFEEQTRAKVKTVLDGEYELAKTYTPKKADWLEGKWGHIKRLENADDLSYFKDTKISQNIVDLVGGAISSNPSNFSLNSKIEKLLKDRKEALLNGSAIDWATAELLAYGSLCVEGHPVRLSGEDAERGTFSHRHSVYYDQETNKRYEPLNNINHKDASGYEVYNSLLSEFAVLGFEYGYSIQNPNTLTVWEAQFGDFANGAVTIYDQYISSGEDKWLKMSGLVSLLPHGFEGQGPEHSSARLERYLQYTAENNIIVCNITTPANLFHALRRQVKMPFRKPLVIMSPKSLLRHKMVVSKLTDFTKEEFKPVIGEVETSKIGAKKVIFTSGKLYFELLEARKDESVAIIRIEQYYPFPSKMLKQELSLFKSASEFAWVQEEPKNMGAWSFVRDYLEECTGTKVGYVGRSTKPSPATGFASEHAKEQSALIKEALTVK